MEVTRLELKEELQDVDYFGDMSVPIKYIIFEYLYEECPCDDFRYDEEYFESPHLEGDRIVWTLTKVCNLCLYGDYEEMSVPKMVYDLLHSPRHNGSLVHELWHMF
jgi:hypothetical protein